ncbi:MAG: pyridoxal phosphate-dependent aminotransferase family protein [Candidatus Binatia bacterium]
MDLFQTCYDFTVPLFARAAGIYPFFVPLEGSEGPVVTYQDKEVVMMGSNNYLGLTHHPKVREAAKLAIDQYGTGCTGSRFLNGNLDLHDKLERELATFFGYDEALVFASGFLANVGVIAALGSLPGTVIFSERENHASLIDGTRLARGEVKQFTDLADLDRQLSSQADWSHALVVCDAVFSMTGRVIDLRRLAELKRKYKFKLYVDDAHGIGVLGPDGRGAVFEQDVRADVDLLFGTFSKSLASLGGFVCGEKRVIDWLRHKARSLIFTAGLPPASVAAALAALTVMREESTELRAKVWANARYWREGLDAIGYYTMGSTTPIVPAMIGSESLAFRVARDLLDLGVFAIPVPFPVVPVGQSLIRTSVMPTHTRAHLDLALDAFAQVKKRYDIPQFDPTNLPITDQQDWSWITPEGSQSAAIA